MKLLTSFSNKHPHLYSFSVLGIAFLLYVFMLPVLLEYFSINTSIALLSFWLFLYVYFFFATTILAQAKGRSKWWAILGFLGLIIVDGLDNQIQK